LPVSGAGAGEKLLPRDYFFFFLPAFFFIVLFNLDLDFLAVLAAFLFAGIDTSSPSSAAG
jgi:hypothetical protein